MKREIELKYINNDYQVIVVGGGLAGVAAAVASSRSGLKTLLIEHYGFLGGMATSGLVNPFMPYFIRNNSSTYDYSQPLAKGIFSEIIISLAKKDSLHSNHISFNEEVLKIILDDLCRNTGLDLLFYTSLVSVSKNKETKKISSIIVHNKEGFSEYSASYFVDATGDADLIALADEPYQMGNQDGATQPLTLCFRVSNVSGDYKGYNSNYQRFTVEEAKAFRQEVNKAYAEAKKLGIITNPREDILTFPHMDKNIVHFNSTRLINKNPLRVSDLTSASIEGREQMWELFNHMKKHVAGFENAVLLMSAPHIGIRESRRVDGIYQLTEDDIISMRKFDDGVVKANYSIDIHNPTGSGTILQNLPFNDYYTIPYRSLVPINLNNVLVAGRAISASHVANSSLRIMPTCCALGQASGVAISLAHSNKLNLASLDGSKLQQELIKQNIY